MSSKRFIEIDFLRGMAVLGMVIFHLFFVLDYFEVIENEMYEGGWLVLARSVQFVFLGLVGVSLALSRQKAGEISGSEGKSGGFYFRQMRRFFWVLAMAMLVTLFTYAAVPDAYVKFGILHLIAVSIFLLMFLSGGKWLNLFLGIAALLIAILIKDIEVTAPLLYPFGFDFVGINTLDYFPIFPWISMPLFGIFLGNFFYGGFQRRLWAKKFICFESSFLGKVPVLFLGKHALLIYMLHIPLILLMLYAVGVVKF